MTVGYKCDNEVYVMMCSASSFAYLDNLFCKIVLCTDQSNFIMGLLGNFFCQMLSVGSIALGHLIFQ